MSLPTVPTEADLAAQALQMPQATEHPATRNLVAKWLLEDALNALETARWKLGTDFAERTVRNIEQYLTEEAKR